MNRSFVLRGNICYSRTPNGLVLAPESYLVVDQGLCIGVFAELPERYASFPQEDFDDRLIIPAMTDLHLHAPQFPFRGLGADKELLDWLEAYTFPEETKYADVAYAAKAYADFVNRMIHSATARMCVFATVHIPATKLLMDRLEESGLVSYVGKVNMDRNCPDGLKEDTKKSVRDTLIWLEETTGRYKKTKPIITPRFVPSCTDELLSSLGKIASDRALPVQSHLSENLDEVAFVRELVPSARNYADVYNKFGLLGAAGPCVMAHCVYCDEDETALMKNNGVFVAHSPESNINLSSGVAPVARYLREGLSVGLATDVAAGSSECMFNAMRHALGASRLRWRLQEPSVNPSDCVLTSENVFYLATRGGGAFFGKVGAFESGYEADILVVDDSDFEDAACGSRTLKERVERLPYLATRDNIIAKWVAGVRLF